ncbi:MAG: hypothetical protein ACLT98_10120 [Eggerthellaceae bacterium]
MVDAKASDVFIIAGLPLAYSVRGRQVRLDSAPFKPADTEAFVGAIYEASGRNMDTFMQNGNHDDDFRSPCPASALRANVFRQRGSYGAVIRVIPGLPDPAEFHPDEVLRLASSEGLVLVTGRRPVSWRWRIITITWTMNVPASTMEVINTCQAYLHHLRTGAIGVATL